MHEPNSVLWHVFSQPPLRQLALPKETRLLPVHEAWTAAGTASITKIAISAARQVVDGVFMAFTSVGGGWMCGLADSGSASARGLSRESPAQRAQGSGCAGPPLEAFSSIAPPEIVAAVDAVDFEIGSTGDLGGGGLVRRSVGGTLQIDFHDNLVGAGNAFGTWLCPVRGMPICAMAEYSSLACVFPAPIKTAGATQGDPVAPRARGMAGANGQHPEKRDEGRQVKLMVWCGVVWCGVVWCGVVWCDAFMARPGGDGLMG